MLTGSDGGDSERKTETERDGHMPLRHNCCSVVAAKRGENGCMVHVHVFVYLMLHLVLLLFIF